MNRIEAIFCDWKLFAGTLLSDGLINLANKIDPAQGRRLRYAV